MTSVLLHILDDRQIRAVRFVSVTVVMAENAAALERIISHVRRLRGERVGQPGLVTTRSIERHRRSGSVDWERTRSPGCDRGAEPGDHEKWQREVAAQMIRFAGFMAAGTRPSASGPDSGSGPQPGCLPFVDHGRRCVLLPARASVRGCG
ncbi:hypothetical protein [Streptomyces sp. NPDC057460]|uniref:hypothetical protein n=1 Tax=Streptomyces sp. NPDC057460 TaxID=3346141 RepID=UPI0036753126